MNNSKFLTYLFVLIFTFNFAKGQEIPPRASIVKVYPFSALKDEFRLGLEKELKQGKSIEFGGGYLYRTFERKNCNECYFLLPGYIASYYGKGANFRVNWNSYSDSDSTTALSGTYTSMGLMYKYITLDKPDHVPSGPKLPYGYYYANQHALYLQRIFGKQFIKNNLVTNFYGGISIYGQLNYFRAVGYPYAHYNLQRNPQLALGLIVNLGVSFGYKYN